jgi:hypothetical protein
MSMRKLFIYGFLSLIIICLYACSNENIVKSGNDQVDVDTVSMAKINSCDSVIFTIIDGGTCVIKANIKLSYPVSYQCKEKTDALQALYANDILDISSDTASLASAFLYYMEKMINRYRDTYENVEKKDVEEEFDVIKRCDIEVETYSMFNNDKLLSLCKKESVLLNEEEKFSIHYFYTYDLDRMKRLTHVELCGEENEGELNEMLRIKLRNDMSANSDDDLVDMGYYNIDNLMVNDNFYITKDSVIWGYLQRELSVFDEVRISLPRETIQRFKEKKKK